MADRIYLTRENGRLERTDVYLVRMTMTDGTVYEDLEPRRLFPISNLDEYITLLDSAGKEVALVRKLSDLDADSEEALRRIFADYYMVPQILSVLDSEEKFGSLKWKVRTDRGDVSFRINNRHNDIKVLYGTRRMIIRDSNDNRYEIPDLDALDKRSRMLLFSYT